MDNRLMYLDDHCNYVSKYVTLTVTDPSECGKNKRGIHSDENAFMTDSIITIT